MGFNISGIAIDASFEDKLEELQDELNLTFEYVEDVIFENASSNWTDEGVANLYFTKGSTLIFLNMEMCIAPFHVKNQKVLTYALSEVSMAFCVNYSEDGELKRYIMEHDAQKMAEEGEAFAFEGECGDTSEIIWKQLDEVLDIPFHEIDLGAKAKRYKVSHGRPEKKVEEAEVNVERKPKQETTTSTEQQTENKAGSKDHQKDLEKEYRQLSNNELSAEFNRILKIPNARTNVDCLVRVTALMSISKERGFDLQNPGQAASGGGGSEKKGCAPMFLLGFMLLGSALFYLTILS